MSGSVEGGAREVQRRTEDDLLVRLPAVGAEADHRKDPRDTKEPYKENNRSGPIISTKLGAPTHRSQATTKSSEAASPHSSPKTTQSHR